MSGKVTAVKNRLTLAGQDPPPLFRGCFMVIEAEITLIPTSVELKENHCARSYN